MSIVKKIISVVLSMIIVASPHFVAFAATEPEEITTNSKVTITDLDNYLINAGYPMSFIQDIDDNLKSQLYAGQYVFESSNSVHGIFTEDYQVEYVLSSDGKVIIDFSNLNTFRQLVQNDEIVEKIIVDKSLEGNNGTVTSGLAFEDTIRAIQEAPENDAILALSNWSASITCSHTSYSGGVAKKKLTYSWKWSYAPMWTLTDKVAMAWSGDFTAEPDTIYWTYVKNVGFTGSDVHMNYIDESGYGYNDYDCNAGCAKGIDIKGAVAGTYNRYHKGTLSATITKRTNTNSRESAIGRYYHKKITPGLSLAFSKTGPSISVSAGSNYDQSDDSAVAFWAISK